MGRAAGDEAHAARRRLHARQAVALVVTVALPAALVLGLGHRGSHMARNLLVPGAGLYDEATIAGVALTVAAAAATVAWVRWGTDWVLGAVLVAAIAASGLVAPSGHPAALSPRPDLAAHEFPLVVLVVAALSWLRALAAHLPGARRLRAGRARRAAGRAPEGLAGLAATPVVDRCRAAALVALAAPPGPAEQALVIDALGRADVTARARRIGLVARARVGGDPLRGDHAHTRAALALWGLSGPGALERFAADARRSVTGVPASEPGWCRLLDGTLAALALGRAGDRAAGTRWQAMLSGHLGLRRGHRPGSWWVSLGLPAGHATPWEHTAATALAHAAGWVGDADWRALRARVLGAAARGAEVPADERTIAAGRVWLALVDDPEAARVVSRPTVRRDPVAVALDRLAAALREDRDHVRRPAGPTAPAARETRTP